MKVENILDAVGAINDEAVQDGKAYKRARYNKAVKWGAMAACAGLIITATALTLPGILRETSGGPNIPGGIVTPGEHPEGVDPVIESMAVYPVTEDIRDVLDATIESVDENTAYGILGLGNHLPADLPGGYHFGKASLYETTMKSGTKYHFFVVLIMDYEPRTNKPIYSFKDLRGYLETKDDNGIFHFAYEDVYIGGSPDDLSAEEILDVVNSIP